MKGKRVYSDWIVCISTKEIDPSKFDYHTIRINLTDKKCYIFTQYNYAIKNKSYLSGCYWNEKKWH